nr:hypothetical protein [Tanacetum cinerariifolium]
STGGPSSPRLDAFIPAHTLLHIDQDDSKIPDLECTAELQSIGIFNSVYDDDLDILTSPVQSVGTQDNVDVGKEVSDQHYIVLPLWSFISSTFKSSNDKAADDKPKDDTK